MESTWKVETFVFEKPKLNFLRLLAINLKNLYKNGWDQSMLMGWCLIVIYPIPYPQSNFKTSTYIILCIYIYIYDK